MKDNIIKLRKEGKSYNQIRIILGCSKSTISYYCSKLIENECTKKINLDIKNKRQIKDNSFLIPDDETVSKIIELRKILKTYDYISNNLKVNKHIVYKVCRKYNLIKTRNYNKISDETIELIKEKYLELKSIRSVSKSTGISRDSISKYLDQNKGKRDTVSSKNKNVVDWRIRTKQKLVEYKGGKCSNCGYDKCLAAMEFHHIDPNEKDFTISGKSWSFERLKKEVDKCILVCNRCHTEIHYNKE